MLRFDLLCFSLSEGLLTLDFECKCLNWSFIPSHKDFKQNRIKHKHFMVSLQKNFQNVISFSRIPFRRKKFFCFVLILAFYHYTAAKMKFFIKNTKWSFSNLDASGTPNSVQLSIARDINFAISLAARYIPWQNSCRQQSWQAAVLLQYYQIPFNLYIGMKKSVEETVGHSWVTVGNYFVCGRCNVEEYRIISSPKERT
jgi:hypothetical protein